MPVHNGGSHLVTSIRSILNQTFTQWELIIADDGSDDNSLQNLPNAILQDPRIKIIWCFRQGGIALRLNQIVRNAKGKYFARMDADDVCHPERLKKQLDFLKKNPKINILGCSCIVINQNNQKIGKYCFPKTHAKICQNPWIGFPSVHPTWMGKTSWFRQNPYMEPAPFRCEDQELLLRIHEKAKIANLGGKYFAYRIPKKKHLVRCLKTHLSLFNVQANYFIKKKQVKNLLLSCMASFYRILKDSLKCLKILQKSSHERSRFFISEKARSLSWLK